MSGEKRRYASIPEDELRRLRQQDNRLRTLNKDLPERLNAIREQVRRESQQRLASMEQRTKQQEKEAKKLKSNLRHLELQTHQRLEQQREEFQKAISDSQLKQEEEVKRLENAMYQGFTEQRSMLLEITAEQRKEYLALNQNLDQKLTQQISEERQARERLQQQLEQEKQDKATLAQNLLDDVQIIWQQIERNYQHQRFAPGKLNDLKVEINLADSNIRSGVPEAAIAQSQDTYLKLDKLRSELEFKEKQWEVLYNAALQDLKSLIAEVQANREYEMEIGQADESQKFRLDVDYWTKGALKKHEQELQEIEARLYKDESSLTIEEIQEIRQQIEKLEPCLNEIVEQAQQEILSSQLRAEIADKVADVLGKMGYVLIDPDADSIYQKDDERQSYILKLQDNNGGEVVTIVTPEKEFGKNLISINSRGKILRDEIAQQENAEAIFAALKSEGIELDGETYDTRNQPRDDIDTLFKDASQEKVNKAQQVNQASQGLQE